MSSPGSSGPGPARWPLARQLPLLTALIIVVVVAFSLTLAYRAMVETRRESLYARMNGLLRVLVQSSTASTSARVKLLRTVAADSAIARALTAPASRTGVAPDSGVLTALARLTVPTDSGLPVELWSADGRRLALVGTDLRADSISTLLPELRSARGSRVSEIPIGADGSDSVQFGNLYPSADRVLFWAVVPVLKDGRRIGYVAQKRRVAANATLGQTVRDLSGEEFTLYFRNVTDDFVSSADGRPISPAIRRDTTERGFSSQRIDGEPQLGMEVKVGLMPYIFSLEAPERSVVESPRATLKRIALLCIFGIAAGIVVAWLISRAITRPLVDLTNAAEAIAQGERGRRVQTRAAASDEIHRLGASFNRMASEVEASQQQLASQVEEALATSEVLEQTNQQLQDASVAAADARDAALEANRAKSDFLAVMSHELRTPLNAIGGYTEILQIGIYGGLNDSQNDALLRIARSQQTLLSLINDVLNFAKLEAGEVRYAISDVTLSSALTNLEELIAPQLAHRRLKYTVHPCDASAVVRADADKLQQVLINLLSNAIKYTPEGGTIDVSCEVADTQVHIRVRDTGIGIAADRLDRIFDPFIQVGRALNRPHEGVGLGLSISRDLAAGMGGTLSVTSTVGTGSTFMLTLERAH